MVGRPQDTEKEVAPTMIAEIQEMQLTLQQLRRQMQQLRRMMKQLRQMMKSVLEEGARSS